MCVSSFVPEIFKALWSVKKALCAFLGLSCRPKGVKFTDGQVLHLSPFGLPWIPVKQVFKLSLSAFWSSTPGFFRHFHYCLKKRRKLDKWPACTVWWTNPAWPAFNASSTYTWGFRSSEVWINGWTTNLTSQHVPPDAETDSAPVAIEKSLMKKSVSEKKRK